MGGADAAAAVGPPHLMLAAAMAPLGAAAVVHAWRRLTNV
jgi:ABC-2 type transport system permease protein